MALHTLLGYASLFSFIIAVVLSLLALFIRKSPLNITLFLFILLGTAMIFLANLTGAHLQTGANGAAKVLSEHIHLAKRVQILSYIALGMGLLQLIFAKANPGKLYRPIAFITLALAVATSLILLQVMRTGHELVYKHGVGVSRSIK